MDLSVYWELAGDLIKAIRQVHLKNFIETVTHYTPGVFENSPAETRKSLNCAGPSLTSTKYTCYSLSEHCEYSVKAKEITLMSYHNLAW